MRTWKVLALPGSGHIEIYSLGDDRKELVKVARADSEAWEYLGARVDDGDQVVLVGQSTAGCSESLSGADFRGRYLR